ncbi:hypothetical protein E1B28_008157 [Marasmius oreades]|uniref:Uncharacterized protein n=1 Tax=Marasmius oreades TaxID=181124 RepID=A0A9P7UT12_9AGAR|nr:uncharacterized protein E1B28_008157 [Marasmius oreades]KAG7091756.1 hypothetical protein E1B28_008157 [Marasmius oreades]
MDESSVSASPVLILQMADILILALFAASILRRTKSVGKGGVITSVVVLNVAVSFIQEYSAEKTMDSLRSLSSPTTVVPTRFLVPGDIVNVLVKRGDVVPADL